MADSALAISAVRVAVHASRDGEMAALTREPAHVRGELSDITGRFARSDARYEAYIELCTNEIGAPSRARPRSRGDNGNAMAIGADRVRGSGRDRPRDFDR